MAVASWRRSAIPRSVARAAASGKRAPRSGGVAEEHLHRTRGALLAAGEEGRLPLLERIPVGDDRGRVDAAALDEVEVDLHRVPLTSLELLHAEGVRADHR